MRIFEFIIFGKWNWSYNSTRANQECQRERKEKRLSNGWK